MPALRRVAARILRIAAQLAPVASRPWADAMLAELHEVPGDLSALRWALGSASALCRHSLTHMDPAPRLAGPITSRRGRLAIAGAVLLLAALAIAGSSGFSESRPANGGGPHRMTASAP